MNDKLKYIYKIVTQICSMCVTTTHIDFSHGCICVAINFPAEPCIDNGLKRISFLQWSPIMPIQSFWTTAKKKKKKKKKKRRRKKTKKKKEENQEKERRKPRKKKKKPPGLGYAPPSGVQTVMGSVLRSGITLFRGDWSWNNLCGYSAESSSAAVSYAYWRRTCTKYC